MISKNSLATHSFKCSELKRKCDDTYDCLPASLRYRPENPHSTTATLFCRQISLHLEFLHSRFLLGKVQSVRDGQPLLDTAREMLGEVLVLWKTRDRLWDYFQSDFDFFVSTHP